ncbi:YkvA family protein [Spirillospora sp. NPDC048911]|uniref:YkvA family protein n=1 Tax=Spirillospora sp. NPDC048911 TaxID=3364527 RepID=UPI0037221158
MLWLGLPLLLAGTILVFATDFDVAGAVLMTLGAVLAFAGILRLRRRTKNRPSRSAVEAYYRTGTGKIAAMIAAVVYIVSPIDLIPDPFLPVGIVDDATALTWLVIAFSQEAARRRRSRQA